MSRYRGRVAIDLGTGDGRLPYCRAREAPERLVIGIDANAAGMREYSGRALRDKLANVVYVRAGLDDLPAELAGSAGSLSIVLPWGSLLAAVARPEPTSLRAIRALCADHARVDVVIALDPSRDRTEIERLCLAAMDGTAFRGRITPVHAVAGLKVVAVRTLRQEELGLWPTTWARRLAHAHAREVVQVVATAIDPS